ncbi:MAG: PfkB family carbohydrate kinase [Anaerolineales bacterium]|nr:PfkB family carbohydrate kinase [Anaerolineales bacterium]
MVTLNSYSEIDYLLIGHITKDLTPSGPQLGGTVSYAGLTARQMGMRVGIVSSWGPDADLKALDQIPLSGYPDDRTTTYKNIETANGRVQYISDVAATLDYHHIPDAWRSAAITHLAPLNQEVQPSLVSRLQSDHLYITPQGWLREWDEEGLVSPTDWPEYSFILANASAVVMSAEDLGHDTARIEEMASSCPVLVITEGRNGAAVYFQGEYRRYLPPSVEMIDTTGAGDIFATAFFIHYFKTDDPWEAGRMATELAAFSTQRRGLHGIPTMEEIEATAADLQRVRFNE